MFKMFCAFSGCNHSGSRKVWDNASATSGNKHPYSTRTVRMYSHDCCACIEHTRSIIVCLKVICLLCFFAGIWWEVGMHLNVHICTIAASV